MALQLLRLRRVHLGLVDPASVRWPAEVCQGGTQVCSYRGCLLLVEEQKSFVSGRKRVGYAGLYYSSVHYLLLTSV